MNHILERRLHRATQILRDARHDESRGALGGGGRRAYENLCREVEIALGGGESDIDVAALWVALNSVAARGEAMRLRKDLFPGNGPGTRVGRLLKHYRADAGEEERLFYIYDTLLGLSPAYEGVLFPARHIDRGNEIRGAKGPWALRAYALELVAQNVVRYRENPYAMAMLAAYSTKIEGGLGSKRELEAANGLVLRTVEAMLRGRAVC